MANAKLGIRHLYTQQCRLRHLRSVCARNVIVRPPSDTCDASLMLGFYFTLHSEESSEPFYMSETIYDITNLNWKSFNWSQFNESANLSLPHIVVKLCAKSENICLDNNEVILTRPMCFKQLHYVGEQILSTKPVEIEVDASSVRPSYDLSTLKRVHTVQRAIKQTRASVSRVRNVIHNKLSTTETFLNKCAERELLVSRLNLLREEYERQQESLQRIQKQCQEIKLKNQQQELELTKGHLNLKKSCQLLMDDRRNLIDSKETLVKTVAQLNWRQKQLITELAMIYPIEEVNKNFTICGVHLPNSEDFAGCDETMISVALGYVCQFVNLILHFLHLPPRYPTVHFGTRSRIYDHIRPTIPDAEREFPLFTRGKDKLHFKYGVFLMNKNISQLRFYNNMPTQDLRLTLPNLKTLIDLRLTNRIEHQASPPVSIQKMANVGSTVKQVIMLSEDQDGSSDNSTQDGPSHRRSAMPESCLSNPLSISLDHGLDEMEHSQEFVRPNDASSSFQASTELRSSEPSLSCNGTDEDGVRTAAVPSAAVQKMLIPLRSIYASESEPEEALGPPERAENPT